MSGPFVGRMDGVLVLIDESGDSGFRIVEGSTSHFVVAMVIFDDHVEAERASGCIADLRVGLRVKPEFKFSKSADFVRTHFFHGIRGCCFRVRAIVVDKAAIHSGHLRSDTDSFYNFFVRQLLHNDGGALLGANIKIDGSGDKAFKRQLTAYLRQQLRAGQIAKFRFVDSSRDDLVQLADMCAGAILRAHRRDLRQDQTWFRMLQVAGKIEDVWSFK